MHQTARFDGMPPVQAESAADEELRVYLSSPLGPVKARVTPALLKQYVPVRLNVDIPYGCQNLTLMTELLSTAFRCSLCACGI